MKSAASKLKLLAAKLTGNALTGIQTVEMANWLVVSKNPVEAFRYE